jgi:hypothetical protein
MCQFCVRSTNMNKSISKYSDFVQRHYPHCICQAFLHWNRSDFHLRHTEFDTASTFITLINILRIAFWLLWPILRSRAVSFGRWCLVFMWTKSTLCNPCMSSLWERVQLFVAIM